MFYFSIFSFCHTFFVVIENANFIWISLRKNGTELAIKDVNVNSLVLAARPEHKRAKSKTNCRNLSTRPKYHYWTGSMTFSHIDDGLFFTASTVTYFDVGYWCCWSAEKQINESNSHSHHKMPNPNTESLHCSQQPWNQVLYTFSAVMILTYPCLRHKRV